MHRMAPYLICIEHLASTQEAAGSIPVGASTFSSYASIAQLDRAPVCDAGGARLDSSWAHSTWRDGSAARAAVSYAARGVFDSHSRHLKKEVVVDWPTALRVCGLCDVLDDPSSCFDFEDASSRLRGDARAVPVAKAATSSASSAVRSA